MTTAGKQHLPIVIQDEKYWEEYCKENVTEWKKEKRIRNTGKNNFRFYLIFLKLFYPFANLTEPPLTDPPIIYKGGWDLQILAERGDVRLSIKMRGLTKCRIY